MKLSTKARYGLRAMLCLACLAPRNAVTAKDVAERQDLPATYLEQLMMTLRKAGLLRATRGAKGGYVLARDAKDIPLSEIVQALEGPLRIADCDDTPHCGFGPEACALRDVFAEADKALFDVFDRITLADLAERQRAKDGKESAMYFI